jgi:hypothetical protein
MTRGIPGSYPYLGATVGPIPLQRVTCDALGNGAESKLTLAISLAGPD